MVTQIINVATSKAGRTYATNLKGTPLFGRTPEITALLKKGSWAFCEETQQTQTIDEGGKPVKLEVPIPRVIVNAVFATEAEAFGAKNAERLFEARANAHYQGEVAKIAAEYKVDAHTLEAAL